LQAKPLFCQASEAEQAEQAERDKMLSLFPPCCSQSSSQPSWLLASRQLVEMLAALGLFA